MDVDTRKGCPATRRAIIDGLGRGPAGREVLDLARETGQSTLDVVPALRVLIDEGLVVRDLLPIDTGHRGWSYRLTARGARQRSRKAAPLRPRSTAPPSKIKTTRRAG